MSNKESLWNGSLHSTGFWKLPKRWSEKLELTDLLKKSASGLLEIVLSTPQSVWLCSLYLHYYRWQNWGTQWGIRSWFKSSPPKTTNGCHVPKFRDTRVAQNSCSEGHMSLSICGRQYYDPLNARHLPHSGFHCIGKVFCISTQILVPFLFR